MLLDQVHEMERNSDRLQGNLSDVPWFAATVPLVLVLCGYLRCLNEK